MTALSKVKDGFLAHIGSACAAAVVTLLAWIFYQFTPVIVPAIESGVSLRIILAILLLSVILNIALAFICWRISRPAELKLRFGILWDKEKNPHCPVCRNAGVRFGVYNAKPSYFCNPCGKVYNIADSAGNSLTPEEALARL